MRTVKRTKKEVSNNEDLALCKAKLSYVKGQMELAIKKYRGEIANGAMSQEDFANNVAKDSAAKVLEWAVSLFDRDFVKEDA